MKKLIIISALLIGCLTASAQLGPTNKPPRVKLTWDPNPEVDIAGYRIYQGTNSRIYNFIFDVPCVVSNGLTVQHNTNWIGSNFVRGATYYWAATAYNTSSLESDLSEEVALTIPVLPARPRSMTATIVKE